MAKFDPIIVALFVILGSCCLGKVESKENNGLTQEDWDYWFDFLFVEGPDETTAIMTTLMRLHEYIKSVDPNKREIVEFWHDAIMDKQEHCSFEYLSTLKDEQKKVLQRGFKMDVIYDFVYQKVIQDCMHRFLKGVNRATSLNKDERTLVEQLGDVWATKKYDSFARAPEALIKRAAKLIGPHVPTAACRNKEGFVEAWSSKGACQKLLTELQGPTMELGKFYREFDVGYKSFKLYSNSAHEWVRILEGCKYFLKEEPLYVLWPHIHK